MPMRSTGSLRAKLMAQGRWTAVVDKYRQNLAVHSQPFLDWYDGFYTVNISLGLPPQYFTMAFDTGSANFWVVDKDSCTHAACSGYTSYDYTKKRYDPTISQTMKPDQSGNRFSLRYGTGFSTGKYVYEFTSFGSLYVKNQTLGLADGVADVLGYQPIDGVLGLAWPAVAANKFPAPVFNMLDQLDEPVFTVWIDRRRPQCGGLVTFGGKDLVNCHDEWNYFRVQEFRIGSFRSWRRRFAIADTGTALLGGPHGHINIIISAVSAQYSVSHDLYIVPCASRENFTDIIFTMENVEYHIPPTEYVIDVGLGDGQCALGVFGMYADGFNADWIFGDTFIDSFCNLYDMGKGRMGFAKAKDSLRY